jgi:hypothetical protein
MTKRARLVAIRLVGCPVSADHAKDDDWHTNQTKQKCLGEDCQRTVCPRCGFLAPKALREGHWIRYCWEHAR